jgi:hypothetical protein
MAARVKRHGGALTDKPEETPSGRSIATVAHPDGNEFVIVSGQKRNWLTQRIEFAHEPSRASVGPF